MQIIEDNIEPDRLYLLDEPEVSLSPQNQVKLAEEINKMARYISSKTNLPLVVARFDALI